MRGLGDPSELDIRFDRHPGRSGIRPGGELLATSIASPYPFAYARTALKYGLKALGFTHGDEVLVPDFLCESLVEPMDQLGVTPVYYPVGLGLVPEWDQLPHLITGGTRALLVLHYFGQPQPMERCIAFTETHGLMLIEDNAHGHGAEYSGRLLGTFGEAGISAPRKSFPLENGAWLYLGGTCSVDLSGLRLPGKSGRHLKMSLRQAAERLPVARTLVRHLRRWREQQRRAGPPPGYHIPDTFREPALRFDYGMSQATQHLLEKQNIDEVRIVRQRIYRRWEKWGETQGLKPLFPQLEPGSMPLVYPALSQSAEESRRWFERGHRKGVDIHSWPTMPESVVAEDGPAMRLWERLVCFPVHQAMDEAALERRLQVL
ncbi:DegT/DnrJ/EryC1/StrS family aminotransferase [Thioalkalivibrio sp. XN279]|uniref:DegT/DnrJ/EryC1/StrS family aminotransferase n=1 Tax=Thioalkalivibrio sp. XN279 TaxID=2714953 RepID=UPI0014089F54|nr:DegT/DnrJ/EryC1/StrS family aminotransferase [Thioalkalivibrio sp. XN279]NHA15373.1 DegT/DnrJ/EryC1/StrS aminotransferase family protein [Thioalkalivibrio sp. XN279]